MLKVSGNPDCVRFRCADHAIQRSDLDCGFLPLSTKCTGGELAVVEALYPSDTRLSYAQKLVTA